MNTSDFQNLIQRLLDGEITADEFAALEAELLENPEAIEAYRIYAGLHCGLERQGEIDAAIRHSPVVPIDRVLAMQRRRVAKISLLAAAAVVMISGLVLWRIMTPGTPAYQATLRSAPGSSFIISQNGEDGGSTKRILAQGSTIRLDHGAIELALPHQVRATLEAPSTLTLVDDHTVDLDRGRVFFEVRSTEGRGFTVVTPHQRIVDLGTAFGVDLPTGSDQANLHVFEGSVRIDDLEGKPTKAVIAAPRFVVLDGTRVSKELEDTPVSFRKQLPDKVETILNEDFESGLRAGCDYAIHIDPTAIRDSSGNRFPGISKEEPWRFSTAPGLSIQNASFESAEVIRGTPIPHWPEVTRTGIGFNTSGTSVLQPTAGRLYVLMDPNRTLAQQLGSPIREGTTYHLKIDVGSDPEVPGGQAIVQFFGSDNGHDQPLAEIHVTPPVNEWLRDQTLEFTPTAHDANGQTLGIALSSKEGRIAFDNLRLSEIPHIHSDFAATTPAETYQASEPANRTPRISDYDPARDGLNTESDRVPALTFDRPVQFGTGRIIIQNLTKGTTDELVVGSNSTKLRGPIVTLHPPLNLEEGADQAGGIPSWQWSGSMGRFNPAPTGHRYQHPDLADDSNTRGTLAGMKGASLAVLHGTVEGSSIRRQIGTIDSGQNYTVTVGIGCRSPARDHSTSFAGYRIRLMHESIELAGIGSDIPPGPPGSVTTVGFSWNSGHLPKGVSPGDPLSIEIETSQAPGYLDLDQVVVSRFSLDPR